jgi:MFS family permease
VPMRSSDTMPSDSPARSGLRSLYLAETANATAAILLFVGLSFYTHNRFGWGARENFTVAAFQGALYMLGALLAKRISRRWGRERSLLGLYACMTAFAFAVGTCATLKWTVATAILAVLETGLVAASWPMLQSLISSAGEPSRISKRLGRYNIIWSVTGAVTVASCGAVIQHTPAWVFFGIIAAGHILAGSIILCRKLMSLYRPESSAMYRGSGPINANPGTGYSENTPPPSDEAALRRLRLALWFSRIALPSSYVVIYSVTPVLPTLPVIRQLTPTTATLAGSIWLIARAAAFAVTGHTTFWHKRPGLVSLASVIMLFAFIGTVVSGSLTAMAVAQILLGFSIGMIYSASLYFGMAVSRGSTEHGGYHEALVGLGQVLGPLLGATMQWIYPDTLWPAVACISGIVLISVLSQAAVRLLAPAAKAWPDATGTGARV